jgi:hypothetical protein
MAMIKGTTMHERFFGITEALAYVIFVATGALGGCAAGAHTLLRSGPEKWILIIFGYSIIGATSALFVGFLVVGGHFAGLWVIEDASDAVVLSIGVGFCAAIGLGGTNLAAKVFLKRLGIEIRFTPSIVGRDDESNSD